MLTTALAGSDPTGVIILGAVIAVGLIRFALWLVAPPSWRNLDGGKQSGDPFLYFLSGSIRRH